MPINPYANQMQVMQTQGIPVQNFGGAGPATSGPTTLPAPAAPVTPGVPNNPNAGREKIARAVMQNRPLLDAWRQDRTAWQAQRPVVQAGMPIDRAAFEAWRAQRPQRPSTRPDISGLGPNNNVNTGSGNDRMRPAVPPVI